MKEGWEYKKLGEVCKIYNGNSINADYKKEHFLGATGGLPFIATKDVSPLGTIDYNNGVRIPNYEEYKVAPANSVFICAEGGSAGKKFAYVEKDVCFGNKLFCITPKDKAIKGKFIYHFVQSDNFRGQFFSLLTGLIGGVSAKKFQTIEISIPPLSEQQSIVDYLDSSFAKIDAMKANAEKSLNEAKALFQASLKEMLEPKEGWEEDILSNCCIKAKNIKWEKDTPSHKYIDLSSVDRETSKILNTIIVSPKDAPSRAKQIVIKGDIIFATTRPTLRRVALISEKFDGEICSTGFCVLRPKKHIISKWIFYLLKADKFYNYIEPLQSGANYPAVTDSAVKGYVIPMPPINEQHNIVTTLDSLKSKVDRLQENFNKISQECDALKQAILRQVFE